MSVAAASVASLRVSPRAAPRISPRASPRAAFRELPYPCVAPHLIQAQALGPYPVQMSNPALTRTTVEVARDNAEISLLRTRLEEKAMLLLEYERRNNEMQGLFSDYQHRLGEAEGQMSQLRLQKVQLETEVRERDAKLQEQKAEIQMHLAQNAELLGIINTQASRNVVLDQLVLDLEHQKHEVEKSNHELANHNIELENKVKELEDVVKVWSWLSQEHQSFCEAESIEESNEKEGRKRIEAVAKVALFIRESWTSPQHPKIF